VQKSTENVAKSLKFCTLTGNRDRRIERRCLDSAGLLRALSSVRMYECMYLCMYQFVFVVCRSISVASQQTPANNRTTTTSTRLRLDHDDITWLDIYGGGIVRRIKRYTRASEQLHWIIYWTVITGCAVAPAHAPRSPVLKATGLVNGKWQFSTPPQNPHPLPDKQKFVTNDCVGGPTAVSNFVLIRTGKMGETITNFKIYLYFLELTHRSDRPTYFYA